ncbi:hypothetical protein ACIRPP_15670 [Streptomyces sp. NPDC101219]|uniref:hypothetical protein n=1 Tax=Streptomyces sp. NPDC101219 TaxID=3366131 RepID=UPI0038067B02
MRLVPTLRAALSAAVWTAAYSPDTPTALRLPARRLLDLHARVHARLRTRAPDGARSGGTGSQGPGVPGPPRRSRRPRRPR